MIYTIHNLSESEMLKLETDDDNFIHISTVTKEILLDSEKIILFSRKNILFDIDDNMKIVNFEKSSLVHELNKKYKEFFKNEIIDVSLSSLEERNFMFKVPGDKPSLLIKDESRLKLATVDKGIRFSVVQHKLSYNEPELNLRRFYGEKVNIKALDVALKKSDFNVEYVHNIQYKQERDLLIDYKNKLLNNKE